MSENQNVCLDKGFYETTEKMKAKKQIIQTWNLFGRS